jgi:hypothetical protein
MSLDAMLDPATNAAEAAPVAKQEPDAPVAGVQKPSAESASIFDGMDDQAAKPPVDAPAEKPVVEARWPENWKELASGGDDKLSRIIARYQSPQGLAKALANAQDMIRSGELRRGLPQDAKPEDVAKWRKENGIPEKPEGYEVPKVPGIEIATDDPALNSFKAAAHGANLSPEQFKAATEWYATTLRDVEASRAATDTKAKADAEDELRAEWGPEYRPTLTLAERYLDAELGEFKGVLLNARLPDGRMLKHAPEVVKLFAKAAAEADGGIGLVRGDATSAKDVDSRLNELKSMMTSPDRATKERYWSEAIQAEERDLIARRDRMKGG